MKGYKVFNPDWSCRDFQYEVGKTYEMEGKPVLCKRGFHFCEKLAVCFSYYDFDPANKVAEIEAVGEVASGNNGKSCTNKISIVRELTWEEVLQLVNTGKACTGRGNSGNRNSGNSNSGNRNSGDRNSGDWNSGNRNSGDWNSGGWNSGNRNSGDWNSGDWNSTFGSSGCFNTEEAEILMFNKPSGWTLRDWHLSEARYLLGQIPNTEWIWVDKMTEEEKESHPEYKTTDGYLKVLDRSESAQKWWEGLEEKDREKIRQLPNFDPVIFRECTGIDVDGLPD